MWYVCQMDIGTTNVCERYIPAIGTPLLFFLCNLYCTIRIMHGAMDIFQVAVLCTKSCYMCAPQEDRIYSSSGVFVNVVDWRYNNGDSI